MVPMTESDDVQHFANVRSRISSAKSTVSSMFAGSEVELNLMCKIAFTYLSRMKNLKLIQMHMQRRGG